MKRKVGWMTCAVAGLMIAAQVNDSRSDLALQAAIKKETVDGDLKGAIEQYRKVTLGKDRAIAARALVRMGQCYEKLGDAEARKIYQQVLREYADQKEIVAEARARLESAAPAARGNGMTTRQVWADAIDNEGAPSPDGRYLSFVDWTTGDLAIRDLATGQNRRLTDKGSWDGSEEFALFSVFSPDGKHLAYAWYNDVKGSFWDLRVISATESARARPRIVHTSRDGEVVLPFDWSRDGKEILALFSSGDLTHKIGFLSVADGAVRIVKTLDWRAPQRLSLSPDGRYIAYDFPTKEDSQQRDIYVLAADGSSEAAVVQNPANDYAPIWTPDGNHLLFASDHSGSIGEWIVGVSDGKARGTPDLLRTGMSDAQPMGFTRDGILFYNIHVGNAGVYVADMDPATGKLAGEPKMVTERFSGLNRGAAWSPDGKRLAYVSTRNLSAREPGSSVLCIRVMDNGEQRELRPELSYFAAVHWSPDGKLLSTWGSDRKGRKGVFEIDATTGRMKAIVLDEADPRGGIWSPDGRYFYYYFQRTGRIVRRELASGTEIDVAPASRANRFFALSPNGNQIAILVAHQETKSQAIAIAPSSGGTPHEIEIGEGPLSPSGLDWTPDGKFLIFSSTDGAKSELWRVPYQGGKAERLGTLPMRNANNLHITPDGRSIVFGGGSSKAEIWEMEHFLPVAAAKK